MGNGSIAGVRVDRSGAIGPLRYGHSIGGLGRATVAGLAGGYTVRIFMGDRGIARVGVYSNRSLTIAANGLTTPVLDAISRK